jgi:hypothetical protein
MGNLHYLNFWIGSDFGDRRLDNFFGVPNFTAQVTTQGDRAKLCHEFLTK